MEIAFENFEKQIEFENLTSEMINQIQYKGLATKLQLISFHKGNCNYCIAILEGHICSNPQNLHFCSKEHENKFNLKRK